MIYTKYPRTYHLPDSPGLQNDDRRADDFSVLQNAKRVIITEKMDGENTSLYHDHLHARSLDSRHHPSRDWIKMFHGQIKHDIPVDMRICGENMYAKHSIEYDNLVSYFYGFSMWACHSQLDVCLDWSKTLEWFELLNIQPVPVLWTGHWDFIPWRSLYAKVENSNTEGFVIRNADAFLFNDFQKNVVKYVRKNHVQTTTHWMQAEVIPNKLRKD